MFEWPNCLKDVDVENVAAQIQRGNRSKHHLPEYKLSLCIDRGFQVGKQHSWQRLQDHIYWEDDEYKDCLVVHRLIKLKTRYTLYHQLGFIDW